MAVSFIGWELGENHRHTTSHWQTLWLLNYLALSVSDEGYSRNESCALYLISTFLLRTIFIIFTIMINELNVLDDNTCTFTMFLHIFLKYGKVTSLYGLCSLLFFQKTTFCFINCFLFSWLLLCIATGCYGVYRHFQQCFSYLYLLVGKPEKPPTCQWQILSHNVVSTTRHERDSNSQR